MDVKAALNAIAPAVENLACHQEQCDMDGVMVKVSRQALDEVVNTINQIAIAPSPGDTAPCPRCHYNAGPEGAERYWEARWRDEKAENDRLASLVESMRRCLEEYAVSQIHGSLAREFLAKLPSTESHDG